MRTCKLLFLIGFVVRIDTPPLGNVFSSLHFPYTSLIAVLYQSLEIRYQLVRNSLPTRNKKTPKKLRFLSPNDKADKCFCVVIITAENPCVFAPPTSPICSVPEPRQQEYNKSIAHHDCPLVRLFVLHTRRHGRATAAQGNIHIVPKPSGQRDMPPPPELGNIPREIRREKYCFFCAYANTDIRPNNHLPSLKKTCAVLANTNQNIYLCTQIQTPDTYAVYTPSCSLPLLDIGRNVQSSQPR